jgi:carbamoyl-phosphate synthase small subunit
LANAAVVLEDGRAFWGLSFGADRTAEGEVVFTTTMTGYQEVATDPSFRGQIVCMTYPLIGNYGVTPEDDQSRQPWVSGMIVREYSDHPSHWRSKGTFADYLKGHGIPAVSGVDTRSLTRHIRRQGAMRGILATGIEQADLAQLQERARVAWTPADSNVVADVTSSGTETRGGQAGPHIVLIDCGVKENILVSLERRRARVTVVPFDATPNQILALEPDGVLTSPGPGDPENIEHTAATIKDLVHQEVPYFGVCLGHQLLAIAAGGTTSKLKFGHRGGNHPVRDVDTGRIYITAQNHGYQVDAASIPREDGWRIAVVNVTDGSVEGLRHERLPVFSVQYHPEGSPGPEDNQYLFDEFVAVAREFQARRDQTGVAR